jgi:hypothetical protein
VNARPASPQALTNSPICVGQVLRLSSTGSVNTVYSWNGPGGYTVSGSGPEFIKPGITLADAGVYSLVAVVNGCTSLAATANVTVNPIPAMPVASSNSPRCERSSLTLSATGEPNAIFVWNGPDNFNVNGAGPNFNRNNLALTHGGLYSVRTVIEGCTSQTATVRVQVDPLPAQPLAFNDGPKCVGSELNLTAIGAAGADYVWTGPNGFMAMGANSVRNLTSLQDGGLYSVSAVIGSCTSDAGSTNVEVLNSPSVPNVVTDAPKCVGETVTMTVDAQPGATYIWSGPNGFNVVGNGPVFRRNNLSLFDAGYYSVTATIGNCTSAVSVATVLVNPIPSAPNASSNGPVCVGETLSLNALGPVNSTYRWTGPNGFVSTQQAPTRSISSTSDGGNYNVVAILAGCTSASVSVPVVVNRIPNAPFALNNGPKCVGETITLTASGEPGVTFVWTGPNGFNATGNSPTRRANSTFEAGTYYVRAVIAGCSSAQAGTTVIVNNIPNGPSAGSNGPLCEGQTLNLTASLIPGAVYNWTGPNGFVSNQQQPSINNATLANAGTYVVTAIANGCTSLTSGSVNVGVKRKPATPSVASNAPLCSGATLNLSATSVPGATYHWTGPGDYKSQLQNPTRSNATVDMAGFYTVIAIIESCTSDAGSTNVEINQSPAPPSVENNSPLCAGQRLQLSATVTGNVSSYAWTGPNGFFASEANPVRSNVTPAESGIYNLIAILNTCSSAVAITNVTINPKPEAPTVNNNGPVCEGKTLQLNASSVPGATYNWSGPGGYTSTLQSPVVNNVTVDYSGSYSVTTSIGNCLSNVVTTNVVVNRAVTNLVASSNSPVCSGQTINLIASKAEGAVYTWRGPGGFNSSMQNPSILNAMQINTGTYSVTATIGNCVSEVATVSVVVNQGVTQTISATNNGPLCAGRQLQLNATLVPGATYSWTGPNSFSATTLNPTLPNITTLQAGSYSVTARIGGCVSNVASTNVVVNTAPPAISAGASNTILCSGQTLNLTASQVDGARYAWSGPNGFVSEIANPVISNVNVGATGTYSVIALVGNCASSVATVGVTVNQTPSVTAAGNNGPLCVGSTLQLTAPTVPNVNYSWKGPNGFSSTNQNPSRPNVITLDAGTYSVEVISAEGCTSQMATTAVQINQVTTPLVVTNNGPLCPGQTLSLSANFINGSSYRWLGPNGFSATTQSAVRTSMTEADAGQYTVTATLAGCTTVTAFTNVIVSSAPATPTVLANTPICEGQDLNLTTNAIAGATYQWSGPNGFTSTNQLPIRTNMTSNDAGLYFLTVRVGNCISARAGSVNVVVNPSPGILVASNNGPVCERNILQLNASLIPGAIYQWSGPNGFTSNEQNPSISSVSANASGRYSVRASLGSCSTPVVSTDVIVAPAPTRPVATYNGPVCTGQLLSLTASSIPGATYLWRGPGGYQSVSQNPVIQNVTTANSGLYSLTAIIGNCTSQTSTIFVTVNDAPISITANNNGPVCEGATLNLTATTVAGAIYQWVGPNGFRAEGSNPLINNVRASAAGEYSVTAIVGQCTLPVAKTIVVVSDGALNLSAGYNGPLCAGQAIQLTASTITGATYSWFGPGGFNSSAQNPVIQNGSVNNSGSYSVTATVGNCVSNVVVVDVVVSRTPSTPILGSNGPVCAGSTMQLTAPVVPTAQYSWSGPNGFSSALREPFVNNVGTVYSGVYTVVINAGGCSSMGTINVEVIAVPRAPNVNSNGPLCVGLPLNLSATAVAGARYNWSGPAGFVSTSQNPVISSVSTSNAGEYSLVVNIGTCSSQVARTNVVITSPGVSFANNRVTVCKGVTPELTFNLTGQGPWQVSYARSTTLGAGGVLTTVNVPSSPFSFPVPSENAFYTLVSVIDANNCSANIGGIAQVVVSDVPMAEIERGSTICAGARGEFSVKVSNMTDLSNWLLTYRVGNEVLTTNGIGNSTFALTTGSLTQTTDVQLISITNTDAQPACSRNLSGVGTFTSIVVNPTPSVVLNSANTSICVGNSTTMNVTLTGRGPWTLLYNENGTPQAFAIGASNSPSPSDFSITLNPQRTTDYVLTGLIDANDCNANVVDRRFRVTVNPAPTATFNAATNTTCAGTTVRIPIQLSGKGPWVLDHTQNGVPQPTLVIGNANSPSPFVYEVQFTPTAPTTFVLTGLADGNNCVGTISGNGTFVQKLNQVPSAEFSNNNVTICEGERAELFLKVTGKGPWQVLYTENDIPASISVGDINSPSPFVFTLPVSPSSDRTYTINGVTDATGCSDLNLNNRTIVRVNPRPAVEIVSNASGICPGGNANITFNVTGKGPWTVIYSANGQEQLPITFGDVNSSSPFSYTMTVNPSQSTSYSVRSLIDGNGCAINSNALVRIDVNNPPAVPVATNNGPRCIGEALQLNASSVAGASGYYWTGPNGFTASNQNPVFVLFPASAGTYSVTAIANGCTSGVATTNVVLNSTPATPTATLQTPLCEGSEIRLLASLIPGARYLWTGPNGFNSTLQNPVINGGSANNNGIYSVVAISGNCTSSVSTVEVRIGPRPTATISGAPAPICLGQFAALTVTLSGTAPWSISYSENGGASVTVNNISFSPYTLIVTPTSTGLRNYSLTSVSDGAACNPGIVGGNATVQVNNAPNLQLISKTDVACGNNSGAITVRATGGSGAGYSYSIDGINFNNTTGVFSNLSAGNYTISVREGNCSASLPVTITGTSAPQITNVTLDAASPQSTVIVTWDAIPGVSGYNLRYRRAGTTDAFVVVNTATNSRTVTGLLANTAYEFQVQAVCSNGGLTDFSTVRNVTTAGEAGGACSLPQGTFVTINSSNSVTLSWTPVQSGAVCYIVSYGRANEDPETWTENFAPVPNTTFLVTGLTPGVRYGFRIRTNCSFCSLRSGIRSAYSNAIFFETPLARSGAVVANQDIDLSVYPNPTQGNFSVKFNAVEAAKVDIVVTSLTGSKITERSLEAVAGVNEVDFDLSGEAPGLYLMQIKIGKAVETVKVIVH